MMEAVFLKILNMSIAASWLVFAVLVLRLLLKKAPKAITVILWALVAIRLIVPFSLESVLSLIPSAETVPGDILYTDTPAIHSGFPALNAAVNPVLSESLAPDIVESRNPMQVVVFIASVIWFMGMAAMLLYIAISFLRIHRKVREAAPVQENIWLCDHIDTPFILGVFRPRIYLPSDLSEQDTVYVIAHEKAHLKRRDHWWKPLGFLLLTVYWFNPVIWIAYILLCRDIELACDEKVIRDMGLGSKKPYSDALISCSVSRKTIAACTLAFGEVGVKGRIKAVLTYKKPAFWVIVLAVIVSIAAAVCFLTNPKTPENSGNLAIFEIPHTDSYGVYVSVESIDTDSDGNKVFHVVWHNDTEKEVIYGEMFTIEFWNGDDWTAVNKGDVNFHTIGYCLKPNSTAKKLYTAQSFDLSKNGLYRFLSYFSNGDGSDYTTWVTFAIGVVDPSLGMTTETEDMLKVLHLEYSDAILDSAVFDIDEDGKDELCTITCGPTSGVFTFRFSASEVGSESGKPEYFNIFLTDAAELSFVRNESGKMQLCAFPNFNSSKISTYDIGIQNGNITLTENGEPMAYWGEQGGNSPYAQMY